MGGVAGAEGARGQVVSALTHADLVTAARRWLRGPMRHVVALAEVATTLKSEIPDAIAWRAGGWASTLVECKTSRSDFLADRSKPHRQRPEQGMGYWRWYFTPPALLRVEDLPAGWGLAELRGTRVFRVHQPIPFLERNTRNEMSLLCSALQRATDGWGLKIFGDVEDGVPSAPSPAEWHGREVS